MTVYKGRAARKGIVSVCRRGFRRGVCALARSLLFVVEYNIGIARLSLSASRPL